VLLFKHMQKENGSVSVILAAVFGVLFLVFAVFATWAFMGRQDYKNNVDQKIADASAVAVQEAETAKDAEFVELEKSPVRTYTGPVTYGSLTFNYPKTWSIYAVEATTGTVLDLYAFPLVVPGIKNNQTYALRSEIVSQTYDSVVKRYETDIKNGSVRASAYRPEKVPSVLGLRLDGAIDRDVQGAMVILPLRDRTIKVYTEIPEFVGDFNNIILLSLTFVP
jgi:hypothetical protein